MFSQLPYFEYQEVFGGEFPGGSVVKTPYFPCRGPWFHPWLGNEDPGSHVVWPPKKNFKRKFWGKTLAPKDLNQWWWSWWWWGRLRDGIWSYQGKKESQKYVTQIWDLFLKIWLHHLKILKVFKASLSTFILRGEKRHILSGNLLGIINIHPENKWENLLGIKIKFSVTAS